MNLSDKIFPNGSHLHVKDVKEFIKKILDWASSGTRIIDGENVCKKIKEEAGPKLT